jgi:hypothetical protein
VRWSIERVFIFSALGVKKVIVPMELQWSIQVGPERFGVLFSDGEARVHDISKRASEDRLEATEARGWGEIEFADESIAFECGEVPAHFFGIFLVDSLLQRQKLSMGAQIVQIEDAVGHTMGRVGHDLSCRGRRRDREAAALQAIQVGLQLLDFLDVARAVRRPIQFKDKVW